MKRKKIAVSIALAATLALTPALVACSGDHYSKVDFAAQDTSYVVTSQGGSTVSYGNYVYFINGTHGYDDTDGNNNVWGDVVKGGLYRAELNGEAISENGYKTFTPKFDADKGLEFKYTEKKDYYDKPIDVVDVELIAPKTIGTTGYSSGGIFIYDSYVYFATPNNQKSSTGTVQTTRTDFFMMPLSGGKPKKIYTTGEGVDTSSAAYAFYKFNDKVYLVTNESKDIVSVEIDPVKARVEDPKKFEVNATGVYFPVRDTYYTGIDNNTPEDFIYFVRPVSDNRDDGELKAGTVIEAMRPDGSEQFKVQMTEKTMTIEAVRDGMVFYRTANTVGNTVIAYTNVHDDLMEFSPTYKAAQDKLADADKTTLIEGRFATSITSSITSTYAFRPDEKSNEVFFIGVSSSALDVYSKDGSTRRISTTSGTVLFIENNYVYFGGSNNDYYRVPLYATAEGYGETQTLAESTTAAGVSCDYAAGYFTYFAQVDQWANSYTYFYKVDGNEGIEPKFVGALAEDDMPDEDELEEIKNGLTPSTDDDEQNP